MEEAHWTLSKNIKNSRIIQHMQAYSHSVSCMCKPSKPKFKSSSWHLLEGVHCCRVSSQGQGKLQHVDLDGAEQGTGFLHNKVIVGLICVCKYRSHL